MPVLATDTWSTNVWVYPTVAPGSWRVLWCLGSKPSPYDGFPQGASRAVYNSTDAGNIVFTEGPDNGSAGNFISTGVPFDVGQWQMITTTYDGTKVRVYKNGILIGFRDETFVNGPNEVRVPTHPGNNAQLFIGKIDEFTVWRGVLTQQEILDMIIPVVLPDVQLTEQIAYYEMGDPNGSTQKMPDHSGNGNDGDLYGYTPPLSDWVALGYKGDSLIFEGDQDIDLPLSASVGFGVNFSVTFWTKSAWQPFQGAFYCEKDPGNGSKVIIRGNNNELQAFSTDRDYHSQFSISHAADDCLNYKWNHVAFVADGNTAQVKLFVNGELLVSDNYIMSTHKTPGMIGYIGYNANDIGFLGDWETTYVDEVRLWKGALTDDEVSALAAKGNVNQDIAVDMRDLAGMSDEWLDDATVTAGSTLVVDNMEGSLSNWAIYVPSASPPYTGTGTISSTTNAYAGSKSLRFAYSIPARTGGNVTGIRYDLGSAQDLSAYDEVKLYLYRHSGNGEEDRLSLAFIDDTNTIQAESRIDDANCVNWPADEWDEWGIDLNRQLSLGTGYVDKTVLTSIRYIAIGFGGANSAARSGTIDIDDIKIFRFPICPDRPASDINLDCKVNFEDYVVFAEDWIIAD